MMDFEAWWAKQNSIVLRMATPELIARAAYNQGRIDRKQQCIAVVEEWVDEEYCAIALEEIKKL